MFAMSRGKSIIDISISQRGQFFGKLFVAFFLFGIKSEIFQQHDISGLQGTANFMCFGSEQIAGKNNIPFKEFRQTRNHWG